MAFKSRRPLVGFAARTTKDSVFMAILSAAGQCDGADPATFPTKSFFNGIFPRPRKRKYSPHPVVTSRWK